MLWSMRTYNSCIKFALAGSSDAEVVWCMPLGVAGATTCYIVAQVLNFQFPVSRSSCIIGLSMRPEPTQQQSRSTKYGCFIPKFSFSTRSAVRISCIWQRSRLQRKFFLCRLQCNVWTCVNIELKQILPSSHSKLALDTWTDIHSLQD